jgi:diacylglycerol kinase family enzyme
MFALDILRGKHAASRHVVIRETTSVVVRSTIPSAAQVDGEYLGPLPVRFAMTDVRLRIVVPKEFPSG